MESSFKKTYEKVSNTDGSFDLKFKSQRNGGSIGFVVLGWFIPGCWLAWKISDSIDRYSATVWVIAYLLVLVLPVVVIAYAFKREQTITVIPNQGLKFDGRSLPFDDVQTIGTQAKGQRKNNAYVLAVTHGTKVKLTSFVSESLAQALATEIKDASGTTWS